jgi:hypothetical protein
MTASTKGFKIGFRYVTFFKLNAHQTPAAASAVTQYDGLHYESARALTINYPQPRKIEQQGDDRVEALDFLPPSTAMDAELKVGMSDLDIIAALSGLVVATVGTTKFISLASDQQGLEPFVGILAYSQSLNWNAGDRTWSWYFFPYAKAIHAPSSLAETPQDILFRVAPQFSSKMPWGEALSVATNGVLTQQGIQGISKGRPHLACWLVDGSVPTEYHFDTAHPPYSIASIKVFHNEVYDASATLALDKITLSGGAPTSGDRVEVWYEE